MRVWIDLSNSPHPFFFRPIVERLEELGCSVDITVRDNAQTKALSHMFWPQAEVIGGESPKNRVGKANTMAARVLGLHRWARARNIDVAFSHNSHAQLVVARLLGIRAITAMDYEHHPGNHVAFRSADLVCLPMALDPSLVRRQGATARKVFRYPGLKEELYLNDFEPSTGAFEQLGVDTEKCALVVLRTPPSRASYHRNSNSLYVDILKRLSDRADVHCVVLPRHAEQIVELKDLRLRDVTIAEQTVDARSLMFYADLVVGAGGTMTRESALLGTPTVSIFAGRLPAVDLWLEERGMLKRIETTDELPTVRHGRRNNSLLPDLAERAGNLVEFFAGLVVAQEGKGNSAGIS